MEYLILFSQYKKTAHFAEEWTKQKQKNSKNGQILRGAELIIFNSLRTWVHPAS